MPALITPLAVAAATVLAIHPAPGPEPAAVDPCAGIQVVAPDVAPPQLPSIDPVALRGSAPDTLWAPALGAAAAACPPPAVPEFDEPQHPQRSARVPGELIDLKNWFLTLPIGNEGDPDSIDQPELLSYRSEFFDLTPDRAGMVFRAPADGVTTPNSKYPRSELREMIGGEDAAWSNTEGTHTLETREAITKVPASKPEVVSAQIHDGSDDVMQIRLEGQNLVAQYADGKEQVVIDPAYKLGTPFDLKIVAADSKVTVAYNGRQAADLPLSGSGWYWKIGAYVQSNPSKGDQAGAEGEVVVYKLAVEHS